MDDLYEDPDGTLTIVHEDEGSITIISYGAIADLGPHRHDASDIDNLPAGGVVGISSSPGNTLEQRQDGLYAPGLILSSDKW